MIIAVIEGLTNNICRASNALENVFIDQTTTRSLGDEI